MYVVARRNADAKGFIAQVQPMLMFFLVLYITLLHTLRRHLKHVDLADNAHIH